MLLSQSKLWNLLLSNDNVMETMQLYIPTIFNRQSIIKHNVNPYVQYQSNNIKFHK